MNEYDVYGKIENTFKSVYKVTEIKVVKKPYGFDCSFKLNGEDECGIYDRGWFKWQSNGNIKLRLNKPL
jgi:hypothetical protein